MNATFDKALIFTDLHMTAPGERLIGLDPFERFSEGLAHALARHPDAQHLILLGDLAHDGQKAEYDRLIDALAGCPIPITVTMGNHDSRDGFRDAFPDANYSAKGFVQTALDLGRLRLLILDTHDTDGFAPLVHDGWLCADRLAWLDAELARAANEGREVVVMCHHPPCPTGFWAMDAIGLANAPELLSRLHAAPHVRHMVCGHIHRTIHASTGGLPVSILKSPVHQMPMILGDGRTSHSCDEPGAYGILLALPDGIVVHTEDFALSTGEVASYAPTA